MGHDSYLSKEEISLHNKKKHSLFKADVSYKAGDALEIPNLENNFTIPAIKKKNSFQANITDISKNKKKSKSNKLI